VEIDFRHTDDAQQLKTWINEDLGSFDALVLNPQGVAGAVSQADRRAIENALDNRVPAVEVHLSQALANALANVSTDGTEAAGPLRPRNCDLGFVSGLGINSYLLAIKALHRRLQPQQESAQP
jgi:3-dehydroquinate dehydratase